MQIVVKNNTLTVNAKHNVKYDYNKGNLHQSQMQFGSITRSFDISDVKANEIKIDYRDGKLIIDLPKIDAKKLKKR